MDQRYCEIRNNEIVNTLLVDPDSSEGADYLDLRAAEGAILMPEDEAKAQYPYAPPPFRI